MSGTPKRSHDDASSMKYTHDEFGSSYPRVSTSASADFNQSFDSSDGRAAKMPRNESREADKRSHLHSSYRVPALPSDTTPDEGKIKEGIEQRGETRDSRTEFKEPHVEAKRESTSKLDDNKDVVSDRESVVGPKNEKEGLNVVGFPMMMSWKDSKESLRGKKYSESQNVVMDSWPSVRPGSRAAMEFRKESGSVESSEPKEAVGENKVDGKGDDKYKEKERKKKEIKLREWGDGNKEKLERRSSLQDGKEANKEDKEGDEERKKEKEKSGAHEKEQEEGLLKEQDGSYVEQRKQKEGDHFKSGDKEGKDKRRERDHNGDDNKMEKKGRVTDKEADDSCVDNEVAADKEESHNYAAQPRKRMLWPKGSPQMGTHEPRVKPRAQDHEGMQVKVEVSSVVYKVGECMQDLIKLWREYEQSRPEKTPDFASSGPTLEIRIPAEHVTATNRQVRGGQLWGTDIYTDDSDLVAVLMHTGYCRPTAAPPPSAILELRATIRVLPPQDSYTSMLRNNVRSRSWGAGIACSYRVERCFIVKKGGGTIELEACLTHTSAVEPTLAPVAVERTMTTRAAASNALRQQRFVREVTIQYNLCNEPWIKYSISVIADKGLKKSLFTSARLKKGEVLYLETHTWRYELCYNGEEHASNGDRSESDGSHADTFRWSRCKKALPQKVMRSVGIPLPLEYIEVIEGNVDWEDVQWSQTGVWVAGKEYFLARTHFLSPN